MIRTAYFLLIGLGLALFCTGCSERPNTSEPPTVAVPESSPEATDQAGYRVRIHFGDGSQWRLEATGEHETVADLMREVAAHRRAPEIIITGEGTTAFVESIGGLDSSSGMGWTYYVNGQWADQGIGVEKVAPGDRVDWAYGSWDQATSPVAEEVVEE